MTEAVAGISRLRPEHGPLLLVVGIFDGLHRGHGYLLRELRRAAKRRGARPAVMTFDHHPDEIVAGSAPPLLCDPDERLVRLARAGVEVTVVEHFDAALRETTYETFVDRIRERTRLAGFVMTPDAAFGYQREGTPAALAALGAREDFDVVVVPPFDLAGQPVRSTEIRTAIAAGNLVDAERLLGRKVAVTGDVVESSSHDGCCHLRFALPVALPPAGRYAALIEPAWRLGAADAGGARPRRAHVEIRDSRAGVETHGPEVLVSARHMPVGDRLRIAFERRLGAG